jgi:protein transport protein SEC13
MAAGGVFESGHLDMVHDAQLDYYGKRLATCSSDRTIKVFDLSGDQRTHIADLKGHEGPVWTVCWAHPRYGSLLASASFDHRVILWKEGSDGQWMQVSSWQQACRHLLHAEHFFHMYSSCTSAYWQVLGLYIAV